MLTPLRILATSALLALALAGNSTAQTPTELAELRFTSDIHSALPAAGSAIAIAGDHTVTTFDLNSGQAEGINELGALDHAAIDAYHNSGDGCGARVFSVDATLMIAGTVMRPADVFTASGTKVLDARAQGIPDGVNLDAVSRDPSTCDLVFSVDVTSQLGGTTYRPDDLIRWNSGSGFSLYRTSNFAANIDALHLLDNGNTLFSLDSDHELAFSPVSFDASWDNADLSALWAQRQPMPGTVRWTQSTVEIFENSGNLSAVIERVNGSEGAIDVNWATLDGTAINGVDYLGGSGTLPLGDGATGGSVVIPLVNDMAIEGTEEFTLRITTTSGGASIGSPREIRVIIRDDEDFIFADGFED